MIAVGFQRIRSRISATGFPRRTGDRDNEAARLVAAYLEEAIAKRANSAADLKIQDLAAGKRILDADSQAQIAVLHETVKLMEDFAQRESKAGGPPFDSENYHRYSDLRDRACWLVSRLLRKSLPFSEEDLALTVHTAMRGSAMHYLWYWPVAGMLSAIEKFVEKNGLGRLLMAELKKLHGFYDDGRRCAEDQILARRIFRILETDSEVLRFPGTPFAKTLIGWVDGLDPPAKQAWTALLQHVAAVTAKAKPPANWIGDATALVTTVGQDAFVEQLEQWLDHRLCDPKRAGPDKDLARGLIWMASTIPDGRLAPLIGELCEAAYRKVPGLGPANVKLGNACLYALGAMSAERAAAELVRLRSRIKFNQGRKQLEKALAATAERCGLSVEDLEESALPDFGLGPSGSVQTHVGDCIAVISIAGTEKVTLSWIAEDGKPRKSVPASAKKGNPQTLKDLRARVKEIKGLLAGQSARLETLYLRGRSWNITDWKRRYLDHPMLSNLSRRLIWRFADRDRVDTAIPIDGGLIDADGSRLDWMGDSTEVSLWHPIDASSDQVFAWRRRLAALEITQPFKQAHREVYRLTDAERTTDIYSNRFAAHILRQHQFNALCQARGWRFGLRVVWDARDHVPTRDLPLSHLSAEFWIEPVDFQQTTPNGVYLYVATDQVRFLDERGEPVRLEEVAPLVFTEVMRDVDLFVGVASVGNDPNWEDGGPEGRYRDYWWSYSFGALGETAKTRHAVLETLIPKLKIADRCSLDDRFLKVEGRRRRYKIHLGSANILMEPNNEYLCIVPGAGKVGASKLCLPFEGDRTLSLILSKAFLLAEDDKITDSTIRSQIAR